MQTTSYTNDWIRFVVSNLEYVGHNKERSKKKILIVNDIQRAN